MRVCEGRGSREKNEEHIHNILNYVCEAEKWLFGIVVCVSQCAMALSTCLYSLAVLYIVLQHMYTSHMERVWAENAACFCWFGLYSISNSNSFYISLNN